VKLLYIALFGLLGVLSRYFVFLRIEKLLNTPFPYGTFLINLIGSFLIGVVYILGIERALISEDIRIGIIVGFLGGFTTFSTYSLDVIRLIEKGEVLTAIVYASLSPIVGIGSAFFGIMLIRRWITGGTT